MSVVPASAIERSTGRLMPLAVGTAPRDAATSSTANGDVEGTEPSNVESSGKHESASSMPVTLPTVASGRASSETRSGPRGVIRASGGTFEPILTGLPLPIVHVDRDRVLNATK
jgi:hypothetical protein